MIDFEDFKILMANMSYESKEERDNDMMGAFKIFDKDNSGYIDKSELVRIVTSFGEPLNDDEVQSMLNVVDSDKDGKINYNGTCRTSLIKTENKQKFTLATPPLI